MDATQPELVLDAKTTALVLIDLQEGIVGRQTEPLGPKEVITNAKKLTDAFHNMNACVVVVRVTGSADFKDMLHPIVDMPFVRSGDMPKNWADIVPELTPMENDLLITKHQWGAFYGTELDLQLRRRGMKTIVIGGIATNMGVESTARDAYERGYDLVFASDAMSAMAAEDHEFAISKIFPRIGRVRKTEEITRALNK